MAQAENSLDGLEERLQSHVKSFEALLALTPAREYYGSQAEDGFDPSEQWNRKKQTKEQKRAAKKAKLDPANQKSALDVMKEQERKRKRELGIIDDEDAALEGDVHVLKDHQGSKRQKQELDEDASAAKRRAKADKRKEARERKRDKKSKQKAKVEAKKAAKQSSNEEKSALEPRLKAKDKIDASDVDEDDSENSDDDAETTEHSTADLAKVDFSGLGASDDEEDVEDDDGKAADVSSVPSSPTVNSPAFDVSTNHSEASSSTSLDSHPMPQDTRSAAKTPKSPKPQKNTSTAPPSSAPAILASKPTETPSGISSPKLNLPKINQAELQERLRLRIEELRARRKADGADGKPARSRQELLDQRRKKEEQRKAHKKELRRQAKEDEAAQREAQLRGSGSPLSAAGVFSPRSPLPPDDSTSTNNNFSFSRLAFADGSAADPALTHLADARKKKGPQDAQTALAAAEKRAARLDGLDAGARADIAEKDRWLHARMHARGERVRDDTSLLKKALKRKEKAKAKGEREWKEREQAVTKGREVRQKKREANLLKRREEKGSKGKKKGGSGSSGAGKGKPKKKAARPGFEGRFKA